MLVVAFFFLLVFSVSLGDDGQTVPDGEAAQDPAPATVEEDQQLHQEVSSGQSSKPSSDDNSPCKTCFSDTCTPFKSESPRDRFNAVKDSDLINKALSTYIADTDSLYRILCARTEKQRKAIVFEYAKTRMNMGMSFYYQLSQGFRELMIAMATPLVTFYAKKLGRAINDGDRPVISEILGSLTPCMIRKVANKHQELYDRDLFGDLDQSQLKDMLQFSNSDYVSLVQSLAQGDRKESTVIDVDETVDDAVRLRDAGVASLGTDEAVFIEIFTKRSMTQLAETLRQYEELRKDDGNFVSLEADINSEFTSANLRLIFMTIARNALDQPLYFAQELDKVFKLWVRTKEDEQKLIRIIRGRADIDMQEIKAAYQREFKKSLADGLSAGFYYGGSFMKGLLAIVNGKVD